MAACKPFLVYRFYFEAHNCDEFHKFVTVLLIAKLAIGNSTNSKLHKKMLCCPGTHHHLTIFFYDGYFGFFDFRVEQILSYYILTLLSNNLIIVILPVIFLF